MKTIDLYRDTLKQIQDRPNDGVLTIDADQIPVFNLLFQEKALSLASITPSQTPEKALMSSNPHVAYDVAYEVLDMGAVTERLENLDNWAAEHPSFLGDTDSGQAVLISRGNGWAYYGNGLITHKGVIMKFPKQSAFLFGELMGNYDNYTAPERVLEGSGSKVAAEKMDAKERGTRASKIVSELNKELEAILGYKPITTHAGRGWVLKFTDGE